jgi:endonuclease III
VKDAAKSTKQFTTLMKRLGPVEPPDFPDADDPIAVMVLSFLMWESTTDKALTAYNALQRHVVDFNDLRVCMPQELVELIGLRYPRALDRCQRLRATLRDVYSREHVVSLNGIHKLGKREIRRYIESLEGMVPYVANRVLLLSFQVHAIPVDDQLRTNLIQAEVADEGMEAPELATWLERHIMASEGILAHHTLQYWIDCGGVSAPARRTTSRSAKTTPKKKSSPRKTASKKTPTRSAKKKTTRRA